ncbi:MAG TPA: molybdenum cofactor biosynthesis protein MoaB [Trueperaceae bacterium]|nr:molybdenum cofactor biosynthesis protein MoaB [Trueperaceae bacterium]
MPQNHRNQILAKDINIAIISISDSRTRQTDKSGDYLEQEVISNGFVVSDRILIKDDINQIKTSFQKLLKSEAQIIITTGGTGISGRDNTIPVVESLIQKPLPGFGELFRMLSYQEVKGAAMFSRATAGLAEGAFIFALPGSVNAVKTAWLGLLKDEIKHFVFELNKHKQNYE